MSSFLRKFVGNESHIFWEVNFAIAMVCGAVAIPLVRSYPAAFHTFAEQKLYSWQRWLVCFALATGATFYFFKLFSPRLRHLTYWRVHPPVWSGWLLALACLASLDLWGLLDGQPTKHYVPTPWDWVSFSLLPLIIVAYFWHMPVQSSSQVPPRAPEESGPADRSEDEKSAETPDQATPAGRSQENKLADADWNTIVAWMRDEAEAPKDGFDFSHIADNLARRLIVDSQSVGITGAFGSGKSTIIKWLRPKLDELYRETGGEIFWIRVSCWGFETSSLAIYSTLKQALAEIDKRLDTFYIRSLPESYRQTFSAGGKWVDALLELFVGRISWDDQFARLSAVLTQINSRLVVVLEDLDRTDTATFDRQEVLAFLHRIRSHANLHFVLVAGHTSGNGIDFTKLTDHVELMPMV